METKHHKTQTRWDTYKHWGETLNHTHSHSLSLRDEILWCYFSQKGNIASLSPGSLRFMHLGLEWDHKKFGWNMKIICIIVTLSFPANPQQEAFMPVFIIYSFLPFTPLLPLMLSSQPLRRIFNGCLKLNLWPFVAFYVQVDKWDLWVCIHKISSTFTYAKTQGLGKKGWKIQLMFQLHRFP